MSGSLIDIELIVLAGVVGLNVLLTLRLAAAVRTFEPPSLKAFALPAGEAAPPFEGHMLADGRYLGPEDFAGQSVVLVFLSANCRECRKRMPEISEILGPAERLGVSLWVIGTESARRLARLPEASPLRARILDVRSKVCRRLNPRSSSPFYVFIDDRGIVQASNIVGDEDWQSFLGQMREPEVEPMSVP